MAFPIASGSSSPPIYPAGSSGNTLQATGFIPQIWSGKLVEKFYASTVLAAISNTDYEGEIKNQGDTVKIRTKPTITINNYSADGALTLQRPSGGEVDLLINQGRYFNTILDDVMEVQSDLNVLSIWSDDAAQQMKINIDTYVLAQLLNTPASANSGATAGKISTSINLGVTVTGPLALVPTSPASGQVDILDCLMRLGIVLDEQNIPEVGRWVVMPAWAAYALKRSELRQAYLTGDSVTIMRNGRLGMVDRFTIYISNLLPQGTAASLASTEWVIFAGHAHGLTFASQITKVETLRSEMTFGTILRGLQVFGQKVVDSTAIAQAIVTKAF
jgi:hypothetical protein